LNVQVWLAVWSKLTSMQMPADPVMLHACMLVPVVPVMSAPPPQQTTPLPVACSLRKAVTALFDNARICFLATGDTRSC
jgi:hypothetical protein